MNNTAFLFFLFSLLSVSNAQWFWQNPVPDYWTELESIKILDSNKVLMIGENGVMLLSTNQGYTWGEIPTGTAYDLYGISFFDDRHGIVNGTSVMLSTTDGGWTWNPIAAPGSVHDCQMLDSMNIYIASDKWSGGVPAYPSGCFRMTNDGGATWIQVTQFGSENQLRNIHFFNHNTGIVTSSDGKIFRTSDGGYNWTTVLSTSVGFRELACFDSLNGIAFAGTIPASQTYRTTDGGITWSLINNLPDYMLDLVYRNDHEILAVGVNFSVYKSTDSGTSWIQLLRLDGGTSNRFNGIDFRSDDVFICGSSGNVFYSGNNGLNWYSKRQGTTKSLVSVAITARNYAAAVGDEGTIIRTSNGGAEWVTEPSGVVYALRAIAGADTMNYIAVGYAGVILKSVDGGVQWDQINSGVSADLRDVEMLNKNYGVAVGSGILLKTTDGGESWHNYNISPTGTEIKLCVIDSLNLLITAGSNIYRSTDSGLNWNPVYNTYGTIRAITKAGSGVLFAAAGGSANNPVILLRSADLGNTWTQLTSNIFAIASGCSFIDSLNGLLLAGNVYRTTNGGVTWTMQQNSGVDYGDVKMFNLNDAMAVGKNGLVSSSITPHALPVTLINFTGFYSKGKVYLSWATSTEINNRAFEIERKSGDHWSTIGFSGGHSTATSINNYSFTDDVSFLPAGTTINYRLKQVDYNGTFEYSKIIEVKLTGPDSYILNQNYPNPFNPSTTISYSIPIRGKVRLIIYDALGREVKKLVDEEKEAGKYEIEFNADGLASGIYFYQLRSEGNTITKKMMVMK